MQEEKKLIFLPVFLTQMYGMFKKSIIYINLLFLLTMFFSCSNSSESNEDIIVDNFDRQSLLINITDNIILPAFGDFKEKIEILEQSVTTFGNGPVLANLEQVQSHWLEAYKTWQYIEMFNLGKAEEIYYIQKMNTYPATISKIENNISTGIYDLESNNNNWVAQGFPALDYLLFGITDNNTNTLLFYQNNDNIAHLEYLKDVVSKMVSNTEVVHQDWVLTRDAFVSSSENSATSSLNILTNDFIYYFEKGLRTNKFGIPSGVFSANNIRPSKVEAYYKSNVSKILSLEALKAVKNFFIGQSYNSTSSGESLKNYIEYMTEDTTLTDAIVTKFDESNGLINGVNDNFVSQINSNNSLMIAVFNKLQEGVVLLKTDMLSALSISVDYIDADGD